MKGSSNVFLTRYTHPNRQVVTVTDAVTFTVIQGRLVPDERHRVLGADHLVQVCPLKLKPFEKAIVTSFETMYALNDFSVPLEFHVEPMFQVHPEAMYKPDDLIVEDDNDEKHPDETGTPRFQIPERGRDGLIHPDLRCIYKPRYMDLGFNVPAYAGMESHILDANSTCITEKGIDASFAVFANNDPFMVFVLENRNKFKDLRDNDILASKTDGIYLVKRTFVERVQSFFRSTLFPLFHYTTNDSVRFAWKTKVSVKDAACTHPIVTILFQLEYILISPLVPFVKSQTTHLLKL